MGEEHESKFIRRFDPREEKFICAPKRIIYDTTLSPTARLILIALLDLREGWELRHCHFQIQMGIKKDAFKNAMDQLLEAGFVKRVEKRIKGKFSAYDYEFCAFPVFKEENEKKRKEINKTNKDKKLDSPLRENRSGLTAAENPPVINTYTTNTLTGNTFSVNRGRESKTETRGKIPASSLPFSKKEKKGEQKPLKKEKPNWVAKLSQEEKDFYDVVTSYEPIPGQKLDSDFVTAQLKKHGLVKMQQAFEFCLHSIQKNGLKKSLGGLFRTALDRGFKVPDEDFQKNKKLVEEASKKVRGIHMTEKYVSIPEMSWDLYYNIPHESFKSQFLAKVRYLQAR